MRNNIKDLSLALGQTDRIPLILAVWTPVIALSFFTFIGVLQINENCLLCDKAGWCAVNHRVCSVCLGCWGQ